MNRQRRPVTKERLLAYYILLKGAPLQMEEVIMEWGITRPEAAFLTQPAE